MWMKKKKPEMLGKRKKKTWAAQTERDHPTDPTCRAVCGTNQGPIRGWGFHGHVTHDNNTDQRATRRAILWFFARPGCVPVMREGSCTLTVSNTMGPLGWAGLRGPTATAAALLENHGPPGIRPLTCLQEDLKCCPAANQARIFPMV